MGTWTVTRTEYDDNMQARKGVRNGSTVRVTPGNLAMLLRSRSKSVHRVDKLGTEVGESEGVTCVQSCAKQLYIHIDGPARRSAGESSRRGLVAFAIEQMAEEREEEAGGKGEFGVATG